MNLFSQSVDRAKPEQIQQIKAWMYEIMALDQDIAISIHQLQCREPGCPPLETIIAVMKNPPEQYKIHKSVSQITEVDIKQLRSILP